MHHSFLYLYIVIRLLFSKGKILFDNRTAQRVNLKIMHMVKTGFLYRSVFRVLLNLVLSGKDG